MEKVATGEQERVVKLRVAFLCSLRSRSGCSNLGTLAGILTGKSAVNSKKGRQDPHDLASGSLGYHCCSHPCSHPSVLQTKPNEVLKHLYLK